MKIVVTGTRGIPGIQGGVETHCEELFPLIVDSKHEVFIIRRTEYKTKNHETNLYKGVRIIDLKTISGKYAEALIHTLCAVIYAKKIDADIVHIHAIGPSLMIPFVKLLGMKAVMTHHGPDYDRQKWGKISKMILRLGERLGVYYSDNIIVISEHIRKMIQQKYPKCKNISLIHNGVKLTCSSVSEDYINSLGLESSKYVLAVGRLVEEKGFDLLINAFKKMNCKYKLVIAGDADHEDHYSRYLKDLALKNGVIMTGFIQKDQLAQLYHHCKLFVLPSFHEGLPISLLEAMNCKCDVLVSDIPANLEVGLPNYDYFKCGSEEELSEKISKKLNMKIHNISYNMKKYDWKEIAIQTKNVYDSL